MPVIERSFSKKYTFEEINSLNINGYAINFSTEKYKLAFAPNSLNILKLKVDPGTFLFFTPGYFLSTNLVTTNGNFSAQGNANILPNTNFTVFLICIALGTFVSLLASYKYRQMMIAGIRGLAIRVKSKYTRRA